MYHFEKKGPKRGVALYSYSAEFGFEKTLEDCFEDLKDMPVQIAGRVKDFDPEQFGMDKPFVRKQAMFTQYAMAAAWQGDWLIVWASGFCEPR